MSTAKPDHSQTIADIEAMMAKWRQQAQSRFANAKLESSNPDAYERRFIEHGAICIFNCLRELEAVLNKAEMDVSGLQDAELSPP